MKPYAFKFTTTHEMPDGTLDPTVYVATLFGDEYHITVDGDKVDLYIDFTQQEVFAKWRNGEWKIVRSDDAIQ